MADFLIRNRTALLIYLLWLISGIFFAPAMYLIATGSIFLMWRKKRYFDILIGFFLVLIFSDNFGPEYEFARTYKNAYIVLLFLIALLDRREFAPFNRIFLLFIPYLIIASVALIYSETVFVSIQKTLSYGLLFFAVPQFVNRGFRDRETLFFKDIVFHASLICIIGLMLIFLNPDFVYRGGRFSGFLGNPNGLGTFLFLIYILFSISHEYFQSLFSKTDLRWILIPILIAVLLTGSRTAIVGILLFTVLTRFYAISPLLGFITFLIIVFVSEFVASNIVEILHVLQLDEFFRVETLEGGSGRLVAWEFAWQNIQNNFWLGRGFAFDEWLMSTSQEELNELGHQGNVHNTYLTIWLNTGLLGLLAFLYSFFIIFFKAAKNTAYAIPTMLSIIFAVFFESWLVASLNPYTIIFLIILTLMTGAEFQTQSKTGNGNNDNDLIKSSVTV